MFSYIKNTKNWYLLELPLIKRFFDSIYINYKNTSWVFWSFFEDLFFSNSIFWISEFWNKFLFYYLDLEKFEEEEFLIFDFKKFNINIFWDKKSILILNLGDSYKILTSLDNLDFEVFIDWWNLKVKNKILNSIILDEKLNSLSTEGFYPQGVPRSSLKDLDENLKIKNYTSILDIYFFKNFFIKSNNLVNFNIFIDNFLFNNENFYNEFLPENKLKIYEKWTLKQTKKDFISNFIEKFKNNKKSNYYEKLELLKKLLLFKNNHNFLLESIDYEDLLEYFEEFNFIYENTNKGYSLGQQRVLTLWKLNPEKIDENLDSINNQIQIFMLNYYNLEKNYDKINELNNENKDSKILEQNKRLEIFKKDLEKVKGEYLKYFREFLEKVV